MRFPRLPGRTDDDTTPAEAPTAPQQHTALVSAVPIPEHTPPPLTSELTRSIRFTVSEPQGYYFEQVETFVQQVIDVLAYYEQAEDRWRQFAYEMQLEVDQQAYDAQRLRSEIELFKVQGSPLVNPDGSYMTESQNSTLAAVSADLNLVKDQLSASEQARLVAQEETNRLHDLAAMRDQEIASLRAWGEQVIADMQALQAHAAGMEAQLSAAQTALHAAQSGAPEEPAPAATIEPAVAPTATPTPAPVIDVLDTPAAPAAVALDPLDVSVPIVEVPLVDVDVAVTPTDSPTPVLDDAAPSPQFYTPTEQPIVTPVGYDSSLYAPPAVTPEPALPEAGYDPEALTLAPQGVALPEEHSPIVAAPQVSPTPSIDVPSAHVPTLTQPIAEEPPIEVPIVEMDDADYEGDDYDDDDEADDLNDLDEDVADGVDDEPGWGLDSELPEGVSLPGTGEAAYSYPAAAPGAPLETHGVPMGVWAPELDPRITQALAEEARQQQAPSTPPSTPEN